MLICLHNFMTKDHVRKHATRLQDLVEQAFASSPLADHDKYSKEVEFMPRTQIKSKDRVDSSHKYAIKGKSVNSNSYVLPSTRVTSTTRSRGPKSKYNTKNDTVSFVSKSSCPTNKEEAQHTKVSIIANKKKPKAKAKNIKNFSKEVPIAKPSVSPPHTQKPRNCLRWRPTGRIFPIDKMLDTSVALVDSTQPFMGNVRIRNDHVAIIHGYGDLQWGNIMITRVYYVEGLGCNLFFVGQFCDADLEVTFKRNTCFARNLEGVDPLTDSRGRDLYTINLYEMTSSYAISLMNGATSTSSWLWHRHLSHLNFSTINQLAKDNLVTGLPKFKYTKDQLCPSCELGKRKCVTLKSKLLPSALYYPHKDLKTVEGWTKKVMETLNVKFDELSAMASEQRSLDHALQQMALTTHNLELGLQRKNSSWQTVKTSSS
ncbi:retrovirus-related pol polyprotein from transposon TNT 1-94 [Tanacetum coccineum]|uniref:Retrovirus-related pol polyprotein from transposon TNT 1-94 n=1 Tax=Tanacetum coccineum TaxID=301880 RepID=A0ABQ5F2J7_9ASTR